MFSSTPTFFSLKLLLLIFLFSIGGSTLTYGQSGNPFEIKSRLKEVPVEKNDRGNEEKQVDNSNPFEIIRNTNISGAAPPATIIKPQIKEQNTPVVPLSESKKKSFLFIVILSMLVFAAVTITMMREYIHKAWKAFRNDNILTQLHREQGFLPQLPYILLYVLFFVNAGIFTWLLLEHYDALPFVGTWINLYASTGIILAIFLFKHIILRLLGSLFPVSKELSIYSFSIMIFNIIIGLGLGFFNFGLAYLSEGFFNPLFWITIGLIVVVFLFRQLRGLFTGGKYLAMHKFHFLLYLCAVEIAPVLVYLKLILLAQEA